MNTQSYPSVPVTAEPQSLDAKLVVGGQRISISVSVEPETIPANNPSKTSIKPETIEDDIYLLLKGPAHIIPDEGGQMRVAFLDEAGNRKQFLHFKPDEMTGINMLRVKSLDLIIECNKAEFDALTLADKKAIFPDDIEQIVENEVNRDKMNTTDPPIKR